MSFEPIGMVTVFVGMACVVFGPAVSGTVFACFLLLGAAAAAVLTALGGSSVQPSHLLLMFLLADLCLRPGLLRHGLNTLRFPQAGFWLLLTIAYGVVTAILMPRLFAGATYVFTPARSDSGALSVLTVPLAPTGANLTQSIYFVSDLVCFVLMTTYASRRDATLQLIRTMIICGALNLVFAGIDLATYYTNTAEYLSFIRNSSYRMLDDLETAGLKRIVGSFTEAAVFAYATLGLMTFNLRLWSEGVATRYTGPIAGLSILAILFATSSTGYVGLAGALALQFVFAIQRLLAGRAAPNTIALLGLAPVLCALCVAAVALSPEMRGAVSDLIDATLFNKLSSGSGIERGAWNRQAIVAISDTLWLGAGIGSVRASSWLIAVPASIGAIGAALYGWFVVCVLIKRHSNDDPWTRAVRAASRDACLSQLLAASVAGSFVDLGLAFFLYAGIACGLRPTLDRFPASSASFPARRPRGLVLGPLTPVAPPSWEVPPRPVVLAAGSAP